MKVTKKLLLVVAIACACGTAARAAERGWNWNGTYTIPDDGYTYTLDATITLTAVLTNNGSFNIVTGGNVIANGSNITVNNGTINIMGGTLGSFSNGDSAEGIINLHSGFLAPNSGVTAINSNNYDGTINIFGGELKLTGGNNIRNGYNSHDGYIYLNDGKINIAGGGIANGFGGVGTITCTTSGIFDLSGTLTNGFLTTGNLTIEHPAQFLFGDYATLSEGGATSNISIFGKKVLIFGGFKSNSGSVIIDNDEAYYVGPYGTYQNDGTVTVSEKGTFNIAGKLQNNSAASVNIYGTTYSYSYIENGDGSNPGAINVYYPGSLYLLRAELRNGNAGSAINIESGGALRSYHGDVDATLGSLNIKAGGYYDHVRGNNPTAYLTITSGGIFIENNIITLEDSIELDYTWTITNKSTINAQGHKIIFGSNGSLFINGADASLLIKDAFIEDVSGNQIRCSDDTTTLSIDNVSWVQDANYSFTKGTLNIGGDWIISGSSTTFAYQTSQESTIQQEATLLFDRGVTFSFDSATATNIAMIDKTSVLHLNGADLYAAQDVRFKKGTLVFDDIITFAGATKSIYFGNSTAADNITLNRHPGGEIRIGTGVTLVDQNV